MGCCQAGPHHEFYNKVAIAYTPQTVLRKRLESEFLCEEVAVNSKGVAGKRARAQRKNRYSWDELAKTFEICGEREGMGQEKVGPTNGLPTLWNGIVH